MIFQRELNHGNVHHLQLKDHILNLEDALDPDAPRTPFALSPDFPLEGTLFLGQQRNAVPTWVQLLNPHLQAPLPNIHTAGISAVLIVRYQDRLYALTFGHGKSLLHPTSWVRNFGLVTLNRVNPGKLRSMDSRVYDELVVSTRRQTSKSSQLDNFELDINRSLLKGVTGDAEEGEVFTRLTGADGLKITTSLDFIQLDELLEEILAAYEDDVYRDRFGWIDNIREVEAAETEPLNDLLVASLRDEEGTDAYLAPPDTIEWSEVKGFNFTGGARTITYAELSIDSYLGILRHRGTEIDAPLLKRHRVRVREEGDDQLHDKWSIYDCLVWETIRLGHRYVLFDGLWFEIDVDFANRVDHFVEETSPVEEIDFSPALVDESEEIYNLRFATMAEGRYAVLDRAVFRPEGALSPLNSATCFRLIVSLFT